ncbi:MAG TPA: HAD-IA family hydrolase [Roseiflexaceae bacterium]|nr:HAD-IA family hydrolase [Roseiflexaceae bacterium]
MHPALRAFRPELVIFDKDGTLLDFAAMWGGWALDLALRLERAAGLPLLDRLGTALGFDPRSGAPTPEGPLAVEPMAALRAYAASTLAEAGLSPARAEAAIAAVWASPDPVALARPLADLPALFAGLRAAGARVAVATADDRAPTEATLAQLGLAALVDRLACADDGLPPKPAPDMVLRLCAELDTAPARAALVGDSLTDMRMGRAAGVGLLVGVASGTGHPEALRQSADLLLGSVAELLAPQIGS